MTLRLSLILQVTTSLLSVAAFSVGPNSPVRTSPQRPTTETQRPALIYGWDDDGDDDMAPPVEMSFKYETELPQCTTEGVAVAESISYDPDRLGSLARLAVAFSPPERALKLDQIERVDILCVSQKHIDIQAIICEDGGCVSLAVPIQFPKACDRGAHLEGCVVGHLDTLDVSAATTLSANAQGQLSWESNENVAYPNWWVSPTSYDMIQECKNMCGILNDPEFQPEVLALVQEAASTNGVGIGATTDVKVIAIGPAGFHFKARSNAMGSSTTVQLLDVFSPFGGTPRTTSDDLRAAVLGTVATAGGEPA